MDFSKSFEEVLKKNFKGNFKENFKEIAQEKRRLMQEILGIRRNAYIQVQDGRQVTYGGSQLFFRPLQDKCSQRKYRGGCGMVALGDLLLYLMEKEIRPYQLDGITYHTVFEEKEAYRIYFNKLCRKLKWFPTQNGMSGILMAIRFNAFMWKRRMTLFQTDEFSQSLCIPLRKCNTSVPRKRSGNNFPPDDLQDL